MLGKIIIICYQCEYDQHFFIKFKIMSVSLNSIYGQSLSVYVLISPGIWQVINLPLFSVIPQLFIRVSKIIQCDQGRNFFVIKINLIITHIPYPGHQTIRLSCPEVEVHTSILVSRKKKYHDDKFCYTAIDHQNQPGNHYFHCWYIHIVHSVTYNSLMHVSNNNSSEFVFLLQKC